jgi:phenylacetate-CoA ligase
MTSTLSALHQQLRYVSDRSPFYRRALQQAGIDPGTVSLDEFLALPPLMDKEVERELLEESQRKDGHPFGSHLCAAPEDLSHVLTTSGTTGAPTWYLFTRSDWRRAMAVDKRALRSAGVRRGDRAVYAFRSSGYIATLHVQALRELGVVVFEAGAESSPERLADFCERLRPTIVLGTPTTLTAVLATGWRPPPDARVRIIICGGEPAAGIPGVRSKLEGGFGGALYDIFGPVSGNMFMSCSAPAYAGLHFLSPDIGLGGTDLHEVGTGRSLTGNGDEGELYYSALRHEAAPLVKYASGDMVRVVRGRCECGSTRPRVFFRGRIADMVSVGDRQFGPWTIREALAAVPGVSPNIRVVTPSRQNRLWVLAEASSDGAGAGAAASAAAIREGAEQELTARLGVRVRVDLVAPGALPTTAAKTAFVMTEDAAAYVLRPQ